MFCFLIIKNKKNNTQCIYIYTCKHNYRGKKTKKLFYNFHHKIYMHWMLIIIIFCKIIYCYIYVNLMVTKSFGAKGFFDWCAPSIQPVHWRSLLYAVTILKHLYSISCDFAFLFINPGKHLRILFRCIIWFEISIK